MKTCMYALATIITLASSFASAKSMVAEGVRLDTPGVSCILEIHPDRSLFMIREDYCENVLASFVLGSSASNSKISVEKFSGNMSVEITEGQRTIGCRVLESDIRIVK